MIKVITKNQFFFREKNIENTVVNNFNAPKQLSRKFNDNVSYEKMPRLQTEIQTPTIIETGVIPTMLETIEVIII